MNADFSKDLNAPEKRKGNQSKNGSESFGNLAGFTFPL